MARRAGALAGVVMLVASCASDPTASAQKEVRALLTSQAAAWNRGDIHGFMAGYEESESIVFTSGARVRRGFETTRKHFVKRYGQNRESMGRLSFSELEVHPLGPDAAWALGHWQLRGIAGDPGGVFTLVLVRKPAGWRIVLDHTSTAE